MSGHKKKSLISMGMVAVGLDRVSQAARGETVADTTKNKSPKAKPSNIRAKIAAKKAAAKKAADRSRRISAGERNFKS